jgi:hypothetical protein
MADKPIIRTTESQTVTMPVGEGVANTTKEVDDIMSEEAVGAFLQKKGVNLETGERNAPVKEDRKEHEPATPEQKKELETMIDSEGGGKDKTKEPDKKDADKATSGKDAVDKEANEEASKQGEEAIEKPKEQKKFDDLSDDGINREVESLKTGKRETKERFSTILRELKAEREAGNMTKKEYEASKAEINALKAKLEEASKGVKIPEDVIKQQQTEREELAMFRRQYDLERDPQVKKEFDDLIKSNEDGICKTLSEAGVPEKAIEMVKNSGGWAAFSKSREPMSWNEFDDNGEVVTKRGTKADYAATVTRVIDSADNAAIQARVGQQFLLKDRRSQFIAEEKKRALDYFSNREAQMNSLSEGQKYMIKKAKDDYLSWADKMEKEAEWLKEQAINDKASAEEKARIEALNKHTQEVKQYIRSARDATTLDGFSKFVERGAKGLRDSFEVEPLRKTVQEQIKQIESLKSELSKVRSGGRSVPKSGGVTASGEPKTETRKTTASTVDDILNDLDKWAMDKGRE